MFGCSEVEIGLFLILWLLVMMVMVLLVGYLIECVYVGLLGVLGLFIMVVGFFFLVLLFVLFVDINIIWLMILCGVGFGLF